MNPLSSLIQAMLQHQIGVTVSNQEAEQVRDLERIVMEGGIATFLESSDPETVEKFTAWMESHHTDPDLVTKVFTTFPALFAAVHREMVETIEATKRTTVVE